MRRLTIASITCCIASALAANLARPLTALLELRAWAARNPQMLNGEHALAAVVDALTQDGYPGEVG